jgi:hypothetical protein
VNQNGNLRIEQLRQALRQILDLLSDGPGGPRRLTAMDVAHDALEQDELERETERQP